MTHDRSERAEAREDDSYPSLWALRRGVVDPVAFLGRQAGRGDLVAFRLRTQPVLLISDPAVIEQVLVHQGDLFSKAPAVARAGRLLGRGLLTAEPPLHPRRRRLMQPAFHRQRLEGYADAIVLHASRCRDEWADGKTIDLARAMTSLALRAVGDTLFGTSLAEYELRLGRVLASALASLDPLVALVAPRRRLAPARERILAIVGAIIESRRRSGDVGDDLLGLLLQANREEPDDTQLLDDILTMLLAGHDTIANAMTWAWMSLAMCPDADARLADEVASVVGDRLPNAADVPRLTWTRAVVSEALRLRPPAWVLARRALEDVSVDGARIPRGTVVLMSPYLVHRDPRFFADPLAFRPERWVNGEASSRPRLAYFPFGAGRRSCIGEHFAWMEGVLVLATIAARWRVELVDGPGEAELRITMRPRGPVRVTCRARAIQSTAGGSGGVDVGRGVRRLLRQRVAATNDEPALSDTTSLGADGVGLDSVGMVELLLECETAFDVRLPPDAVEVSALTIGGLVALIEAARDAGRAPTAM